MAVTTRELERLRDDIGEIVQRLEGSDRDLSRYWNNLLGFLKDELGLNPWSAQEEIAASVQDRPFTLVHGSNAAGKDEVAAGIAVWWTYVVGGLVLVTSAAERQLKEAFMPKVAKFVRRAELGGNIGTMGLQPHGHRTGAGILCATSTESGKLTGHHQGKVLAIISEAQNVPAFAWEAMLACAADAGGDDRILVVGNPMRPSGPFYERSKSPYWNVIGVSALDHPNVVQGRTVIPGGPTVNWCATMEAEYGKGSPTYASRVLGQFPSQGEHSLFGRDWLDRAADFWQELTTDPRGEWRDEVPIVAVDPARGGPDQTAVAVRRGHVLESITTWGKAYLTDTAARVADIARAAGVRPGIDKGPVMAQCTRRGLIIVDTVGVGGGVTDVLRDMGFSVQEFKGSETDLHPKRFFNLRAGSHWRFAEALEAGTIALPPDDKLFDELLAIEWFPSSDDRVQIVAKKDIRS